MKLHVMCLNFNIVQCRIGDDVKIPSKYNIVFRSGRISSVYIVSKWVVVGGWVTLFLNV